MKQNIQHSPPHPGEILLEFYFEPLQISVSEASAKLLISRPKLSDIVNGKAGISPQMALKLSRAFNTSPQYWMNLQTNFELWKASETSDYQKVEMFA